MDKKPTSIWKKSFKGRTALVVWLAVAAFTIMLGSFIAAPLINYDRPMSIWQTSAGILAGVCLAACLLLIYVVWPLSRWLFWKNWRRGIFLLACLATLIALFYAEEDWRGWHDWNQFKRQWEAKGEKFDRQSVVPAPVPNDENFAMAPIWVELLSAGFGTNFAEQYYGKAAVQREPVRLSSRLQMTVGDPVDRDWPRIGNWEQVTLTDLKSWQSYYRSLAAKTNEFPLAPQPQTPAQDVLLALSKYDLTIEALRTAARRPDARFPLDYDAQNPIAIPLPHLALVRRCGQVLQLRAIAELQNDRSDKALADVTLLLRLANSVRVEPITISQLIRISLVQMALQPVYEGLAKHQWSDAELAALDSELAKLNFAAGYELAMRGEMILCQEGVFDYLRHYPEQLANLSDYQGQNTLPLPERILIDLIPNGWFYQNQLHCARPMVELILPVADANQQTISPSKVKRADATVSAQIRRPGIFNFGERMFLPGISGIAERFAYGQAGVNLARTAIALERYRLAHGGYPESLDALAPQFIKKVPHDVIGGGPLHYRLTSDGQFVLYSIGWNERDDGGVVGLTEGGSVDSSKGDWVWRYPEK